MRLTLLAALLSASVPLTALAILLVSKQKTAYEIQV